MGFVAINLTVNFPRRPAGRIMIEEPLAALKYEQKQRMAGATVARTLSLRYSGFPEGAVATLNTRAVRPEIIQLDRPIEIGGQTNGFHSQTLHFHAGRLFGPWQNEIRLSFDLTDRAGKLVGKVPSFPVLLQELGDPPCAVSTPGEFARVIGARYRGTGDDLGNDVYVYYDVKNVPPGTQRLALALNIEGLDEVQSHVPLGGRGEYRLLCTVKKPAPASIETVLLAEGNGFVNKLARQSLPVSEIGLPDRE